jgi:hypothetical protein
MCVCRSYLNHHFYLSAYIRLIGAVLYFHYIFAEFSDSVPFAPCSLYVAFTSFSIGDTVFDYMCSSD